jgi:hypothetical protein
VGQQTNHQQFMWNFGEEWGGVLLLNVTLNNFHSYIVASVLLVDRIHLAMSGIRTKNVSVDELKLKYVK